MYLKYDILNNKAESLWAAEDLRNPSKQRIFKPLVHYTGYDIGIEAVRNHIFMITKCTTSVQQHTPKPEFIKEAIKLAAVAAASPRNETFREINDELWYGFHQSHVPIKENKMRWMSGNGRFGIRKGDALKSKLLSGELKLVDCKPKSTTTNDIKKWTGATVGVHIHLRK